MWLTLAAILAALNFPSLPLVWHIRLIYYAIKGLTNRLKSYTDAVTQWGFVSVDLCDLNGHMNNSCYSSMADFGRYQFVAALGGRKLRQYRVANGGVSFAFVRELKPLSTYTVTTRIVAWNEKWMFVEHAYRHGSTGHVHATGLARLVFKIGRKTVPPQEALHSFGYADAPATLGFDAADGPAPALLQSFTAHTAKL